MEPLRCDELSKCYGGVKALDQVSFSVDPGEVFGLLGPNGAGKTTLFRLLLGLSRPSSGSARLLGDDLPVHSRVLAQVGAMIEEPAFYGWMSAQEQLRIAARTMGFRPRNAEIDRLLENVGLANCGRKHVRRFSQGMRQRLGIARALMRKPSVLFLDEPANGLDPKGIIWLRELLREQAASGVTVLVSSHQLDEIERTCDRIAIMDHGRIVDTSAISDLNGRSPKVRIVLHPHHFDVALPHFREFVPESSEDSTFVVHESRSQDVLEGLANMGIFPKLVVQDKTSLENKFLEITGRAH